MSAVHDASASFPAPGRPRDASEPQYQAPGPGSRMEKRSAVMSFGAPRCRTPISPCAPTPRCVTARGSTLYRSRKRISTQQPFVAARVFCMSWRREVPRRVGAAHQGGGRLARIHVAPAQHLGDAGDVRPARHRHRAKVGDALHDEVEPVVDGLAAAVVDEAEQGGERREVRQHELLEHGRRDVDGLLGLGPAPEVLQLHGPRVVRPGKTRDSTRTRAARPSACRCWARAAPPAP